MFFPNKKKRHRYLGYVTPTSYLYNNNETNPIVILSAQKKNINIMNKWQFLFIGLENSRSFIQWQVLSTEMPLG